MAATDPRYPQMGGGTAPGGEIDTAVKEGFTGILLGKNKRFSKEVKQRHKNLLPE